MKSNVLIHPSVRMSSLVELVRGNLVVLKYHLPPPGAAAEPARSLVCTCGACGWVGPEPVYVDTRDTFNPPRGDIPRCAQCGSFQLTFDLEDLRV